MDVELTFRDGYEGAMKYDRDTGFRPIPEGDIPAMLRHERKSFRFFVRAGAHYCAGASYYDIRKMSRRNG